MQLDRTEYVNFELLNYTENTFRCVFADQMALEKEFFSNDMWGGGFYSLTYRYFPENYKIIFEYERMYFSISIHWGESFAFFPQKHPGFDNTLKKTNVKNAILLLKEDLISNDFEFYRITESGKRKRVVKD